MSTLNRQRVVLPRQGEADYVYPRDTWPGPMGWAHGAHVYSLFLFLFIFYLFFIYIYIYNTPLKGIGVRGYIGEYKKEILQHK